MGGFGALKGADDRLVDAGCHSYTRFMSSALMGAIKVARGRLSNCRGVSLIRKLAALHVNGKAIDTFSHDSLKFCLHAIARCISQYGVP